jgi:hypothetical protein
MESVIPRSMPLAMAWSRAVTLGKVACWRITVRPPAASKVLASRLTVPGSPSNSNRSGRRTR